jgi:hypothetical protein
MPLHFGPETALSRLTPSPTSSSPLWRVPMNAPARRFLTRRARAVRVVRVVRGQSLQAGPLPPRSPTIPGDRCLLANTLGQHLRPRVWRGGSHTDPCNRLENSRGRARRQRPQGVGRHHKLVLATERVRPSGRPSARRDHLLRPHQGVELLVRHIAPAHRLVAQRRAVLVRGLGDLGGVVVADLRRQRGDQHQ